MFILYVIFGENWSDTARSQREPNGWGQAKDVVVGLPGEWRNLTNDLWGAPPTPRRPNFPTCRCSHACRSAGAATWGHARPTCPAVALRGPSRTDTQRQNGDDEAWRRRNPAGRRSARLKARRRRARARAPTRRGWRTREATLAAAIPGCGRLLCHTARFAPSPPCRKPLSPTPPPWPHSTPAAPPLFAPRTPLRHPRPPPLPVPAVAASATCPPGAPVAMTRARGYWQTPPRQTRAAACPAPRAGRGGPPRRRRVVD